MESRCPVLLEIMLAGCRQTGRSIQLLIKREVVGVILQTMGL